MSDNILTAIARNIMGNQDFAGRGFLARPLYALPVSTVGHRTYDTPPVPREIEAGYSNLIESLLSITELGEARIIRVSPEAHQEAKRFFEELEPRLADDLGDLDDLEGWAGKYHGQVMRLAGIIHCCIHGGNAAESMVSLNTMQQAETIGGYFLEHARAAFQLMGLSDSKEIKDAKYILRRLKEDGRTEINKRDLIRLCRRFRSAEDMEPGLEELRQRGYIRVKTVKTGKPGKPPQIVYLNPKVE